MEVLELQVDEPLYLLSIDGGVLIINLICLVICRAWPRNIQYFRHLEETL